MSDTQLIFKIISTYFANEFYETIYNSAKTSVGEDESITERYIHKVKIYITCTMKQPRCYLHVVKGLHIYFTKCNRFNSLIFADFVDKIVYQFCPTDYQTSLCTKDKDIILSDVICDIITKLGAFVTTPDMLKKIIDTHDNSKTYINTIVDEVNTILVLKREIYFTKVVQEIGHSRELLTVADANILTESISKYEIENKELKQKIADLENNISELTENEINYKKMMTTENKELMYKVKKLEAKITELIDREEKYEKMILFMHNFNTIHMNKTTQSAEMEPMELIMSTTATPLATVTPSATAATSTTAVAAIPSVTAVPSATAATSTTVVTAASSVATAAPAAPAATTVKLDTTDDILSLMYMDEKVQHKEDTPCESDTPHEAETSYESYVPRNINTSYESYAPDEDTYELNLDLN